MEATRSRCKTISLTRSPHSLPGDYGFDPLNLGADAANLEWFRNAELVHGRWAMLGAAGVLVPELLTKAGVADLPVWSEAGHAEYFTDAVTLGLVQAILFNWVEVLRFQVRPRRAKHVFVDLTDIPALSPQDMRKPGCVHEDPIFKGNKCTGTVPGYPGGGLFDPFNFAKEPAAFEVNKVKEIKNGRLAMLACLGFATQAFVTGQGPVANLLTHISDPGHQNFFTHA